jgi:hypothetical protein
MISEKDNPVQWALLGMELDEAKEHLAALTAEMAEAGAIDEEDFKIQLGHVFAHLNRCWNARNLPDGLPDDKWSELSQTPADLELNG